MLLSASGKLFTTLAHYKHGRVKTNVSVKHLLGKEILTPTLNTYTPLNTAVWQRRAGGLKKKT